MKKKNDTSIHRSSPFLNSQNQISLCPWKIDLANKGTRKSVLVTRQMSPWCCTWKSRPLTMQKINLMRKDM